MRTPGPSWRLVVRPVASKVNWFALRTARSGSPGILWLLLAGYTGAYIAMPRGGRGERDRGSRADSRIALRRQALGDLQDESYGSLTENGRQPSGTVRRGWPSASRLPVDFCRGLCSPGDHLLAASSGTGCRPRRLHHAGGPAHPALIKLGVPPLAAQMFAFYFGCLSAVTPPECLAVYAAASISRCSVWAAVAGDEVASGLLSVLSCYPLFRGIASRIGRPLRLDEVVTLRRRPSVDATAERRCSWPRRCADRSGPGHGPDRPGPARWGRPRSSARCRWRRARGHEGREAALTAMPCRDERRGARSTPAPPRRRSVSSPLRTRRPAARGRRRHRRGGRRLNTGGHRAQPRGLGRAARQRDRAARVEAAARGGFERARDLAAHHDLVAPLVRVGRQGGREQRPGVGMPRVPGHRRRRSDLHDLTEVHHGHGVAHVGDRGQVVGDEQVREPEARLQVAQQVEDLGAYRDIEGRYRLVEHHQLG